MPALNFKEEFIDLILRGEKVATTRKTKRCEKGDYLTLYTGQRTKNCRLIGKALCVGIATLEVDAKTIYSWETTDKNFIHTLRELNDLPLYRKLGFSNVVKMLNFYEKEHGLPFKGFIHLFKLK